MNLKLVSWIAACVAVVGLLGFTQNGYAPLSAAEMEHRCGVEKKCDGKTSCTACRWDGSSHCIKCTTSLYWYFCDTSSPMSCSDGLKTCDCGTTNQYQTSTGTCSACTGNGTPAGGCSQNSCKDCTSS